MTPLIEYTRKSTTASRLPAFIQDFVGASALVAMLYVALLAPWFIPGAL